MGVGLTDDAGRGAGAGLAVDSDTGTRRAAFVVTPSAERT